MDYRNLTHVELIHLKKNVIYISKSELMVGHRSLFYVMTDWSYELLDTDLWIYGKISGLPAKKMIVLVPDEIARLQEYGLCFDIEHNPSRHSDSLYINESFVPSYELYFYETTDDRYESMTSIGRKIESHHYDGLWSHDEINSMMTDERLGNESNLDCFLDNAEIKIHVENCEEDDFLTIYTQEKIGVFWYLTSKVFSSKYWEDYVHIPNINKIGVYDKHTEKCLVLPLDEYMEGYVALAIKNHENKRIV